MSDYAEFLDGKARRAPAVGREAQGISAVLFDWQRRIVEWACRRGSAAIFADCGLGKTLMQLEWARNMADRALIVAPLSVARQTVREARDKLAMDVGYVRHGAEVAGDGIWITNYEMLEHFDLGEYGALVLDESSILKNVDGKFRRAITQAARAVPYRLACTATPAPNDVAELTNHAEFLGVMPRVEMLAAYFVHDDAGWRLKGHAADAMFKWMTSWAVALRRPSDLGYDDAGFEIPPLTITTERVEVDVVPEGQLFATELGGVGGRASVRRQTMDARTEHAAAMVADGKGQWIAWCGLNEEATRIARLLDGEAQNVEGSMLPETKAQRFEEFQDRRYRVLVTKPRIGGFGMNFQNASRMVFVGLGDSYEQYYQAIRRCWRFGQTRPVEARIVVSELETQIVANVIRKEQEAAEQVEALISHMRESEEVAA